MTQNSTASLIARDDTMFGICQGIGEDFGFNPSWLRLALGTTLLWNPMLGLYAYAAMGALVLFSRLVFPNPKAAPAAAADTATLAAEAPAPAPAVPAPAAEDDKVGRQLLPLAA